MTLSPDDTLLLAYRRMKLFDVSQMPVMQGERVIGIVDESDLVHAPAYRSDALSGSGRHRHGARGSRPSRPMRRYRSLLPIFQRDHVAIVAEHGRFVGLITRIDLLNYLRKQLN